MCPSFNSITKITKIIIGGVKRSNEARVCCVTGPVGCTDAADIRGGKIIPGIIGGIMLGI